MNLAKAFPKMAGVEVTVEERMVSMEVSAGTWRNHMFTGIETVPERLPAVFHQDGGAFDLDLLDLVRQAYAGGKREVRHEAPYKSGGTWPPNHTVLRTVSVKIQYVQKAGLRATRGRGPAHVPMPMLHDGVWSTCELQRLEQDLARCYSKLSPTVIQLAVRLARLDLRPTAGRTHLRRAATAILERR